MDRLFPPIHHLFATFAGGGDISPRGSTCGGNITMTSTSEMTNQHGATRDDVNYAYRSQREGRGIFISTEARPGFITSEFWLTIIGAAALGILAYASDALGVRWGMGMAVAILVAYIVSRGIAKAGSSDVIGTSDRR
jgi:hypothetical protein